MRIFFTFIQNLLQPVLRNSEKFGKTATQSSDLRFLLFLVSTLASPFCQCACDAQQPNDINLGTHPSTDITAGSEQSNGVLSIQCDSIVNASLLGADELGYTVTGSTNNFSLLDSGSNAIIDYQLSSESNFSTVIDNVGEGYSTSNSFLVSVGVLNGNSIDIPLYIRTLTANIPAGTYTDTLTLHVTGSKCEGVAIGGVCVGTSSTIDSTVTLIITITVDKTCILNGPLTHDFGSVALLSQTSEISVQVQVTCTITEGFQLYLDMGDNSSSGWRQMINGINSVRYNIYHPGDLARLLDTTDPIDSSGTGTMQTFNLPALIDASQTTPPAALYEDKVRVIINY